MSEDVYTCLHLDGTSEVKCSILRCSLDSWELGLISKIYFINLDLLYVLKISSGKE